MATREQTLADVLKHKQRAKGTRPGKLDGYKRELLITRYSHGHSAASIARELKVSPATVNYHVAKFIRDAEAK